MSDMRDAIGTIPERIQQALNRTWDVISTDILAAKQEQGQGEDMSREDVIEVVCDAGHLESYGNDSAAVDIFRDMVDIDRAAICKLAFPFEVYCW